jgi:AcrR family transcriptional regulator
VYGGGVDGQEIGLRERTRRAVRAELVSEAMELFLDKGFESTTVEDIAVAAGLSRRSYFRYFASKDDVLAEGLAQVGDTIAETVRRRPPAEPPWTALRRGFDALLEQAESHPRARDMGRLFLQNPVFEASHQSKQVHWQTSIAAALEERLPEGAVNSSLTAKAIAAAGLGCFNAAQAEWHRPGNTTPLAALMDSAMGAVKPLSS